MGIIQVNQIKQKIKNIFQEKIDISDIKQENRKEITLLTRGLAAYAILILGQTSESDAANSIVDGYDDNGIDAIYYSSITKKLFIVQSKWIQNGDGEPESGDIAKFINGIKDLVNSNYDRFNSKIRHKQSQVESALNEYGTTIEIVLIYTGKERVNERSQRLIQDLIDELNDIGEGKKSDIAHQQILNQSKIYSTLAQQTEGEPITLNFALSQWGKIEDPIFAYTGIVSGREIYEWYQKYNHRLFAKNIRKMLGNTEINKEIENTIYEQPDKFWYFNNGLTLTADTITKSLAGGNSRDIGSFEAKNISIVNGAQTVSTIGKLDNTLDNLSKLEQVRVPIRIISLSQAEEDFGSKVTRNNNRQNRIENRDFIALNEYQIALKTELAIDGIEYNITRSEDFMPSEKSFDVNEAVIALACSSNIPSLAVQAKREIGKFYENLTKQPYTLVFNKSVTGAYMFYTVQCLRYIDRLISEETSKLEKHSGKRYGILVHGNRMLALLTFTTLKVYEQKTNSIFSVEEDKIKSIFYKVLPSLENEISSRYSDKLLGTLFKNQTLCKEIFNTITTQIN